MSESTKKVWSVEHRVSGLHLGYYMANDEDEAIEAMISDAHGDPDTPIDTNLKGWRVDFEAAVMAMDDTIRERLHAQDFDNDADFLTIYELMHWNKFREQFVF